MSKKIDQAFVNTYIDAGIGLPIAHENTAYSPTAGTEYVELINLPNDITPLSINDTNETDGLFRIILYWPVNVGSVQAKLKADEILAVFTIGSRVCYDSQCATITRASRQKGIAVDGWYKTILTIGYYAAIGR
jgi:hypothetical protein